MILMRFDPFRELGRLADQAMPAGARALHGMPMEALRRGDEFIVHLDGPLEVLLGSADRPSDAPDVVAGCAPAQEAAAAATEPAPAGPRSAS